jgi:hypothetical protein
MVSQISFFVACVGEVDSLQLVAETLDLSPAELEYNFGKRFCWSMQRIADR